ncbi:MAG: hypothetical protein K5765_07560 [Clostridia bacterium]|nr:hypothetical protein [Clostridia bacterium]
MGIVLFLSSLTLFQAGLAPSIAVAVFSILIGLAYIFIGIVYLLELIYLDRILDILNIITYLAYPFYILMKAFIVMFSGSASGYAAVGWIKIILEVIAVILLIVFYILWKLNAENKLFKSITRVAFYLLICLLIVDLVFANDGVGRTIGEILITSVLTVIVYACIGIEEFKRVEIEKKKKEEDANKPKVIDLDNIEETKEEEIKEESIVDNNQTDEDIRTQSFEEENEINNDENINIGEDINNTEVIDTQESAEEQNSDNEEE